MRRISYEEYFERVYGGWLGKCIGGAVGARVEGRKELHSFTEETAFPEEWPPNDDLDLQVLWLHALQTRGVYITSRDLAEEWVEHCWYYFNEYGRFLKNFHRGIDPPVSGWFDNEYFRESMGSPIRSEIWGFTCPGNPGLAAHYAGMDAVLDHWRGSVWAEQFLAAIEAEAFFTSDLEELVEVGLKFVPRGSRLRGVVELVKELWRSGVDWVEARWEVLRRYGSPDFTSVYQNIGFTMIALLWGGGDFVRTMLIALNCGYDTDCTCATACAILGELLGAEGIPEKWKAPLRDEFVMGFSLPRSSYRISDLARETCEVGVAISRVLNRDVEIVGAPEPRIPLGRPHRDVEVSVDYLGLPAVGRGEVKELEVRVRNNGSTSLVGVLELEVPEGWRASEPHIVSLAPGEERGYRFRVTPPAEGVLWDRNMLRARLCAGGRSWVREFGLCGSKYWRVLGPYWRPRGPFEDEASLDEEYVDEGMIEEGRELELFQRARGLNSPTDKLPLDEHFPLPGEYCIYLLHRLYCPSEREVDVYVGAAGDVRVWLNGEVVCEGRGRCVWSPLMYRARVRLREGENRLVVKYVKKARSAELSVGFYRENVERRPGYSVWQVDLGSVL